MGWNPNPKSVVRAWVYFEVHSAAVQGDGLDGPMGVQQHRAPWSLIHAARLHAHEAGLHQINAAHAVCTP